MVKSSGRFRNRKLGFKSRISIVLGVDSFEEDPLDDIDIEDDPKAKGVETGVDKDEEGEVHLQAVIAATAAAAAMTKSSSNAGATPGSSSSSSSGRQEKADREEKEQKDKAYIPTPDAAGAIDVKLYDQLYPKNWVEPTTYIRFSDTVEDTTKGAVNYTMDEDDEDWLEDYNKRVVAAQAIESTPNGSKKKGKDKVKSEDPSSATVNDDLTSDPISEDDFERVMELLEQLADQKSPMARIDPTLLPSVADMELHISESTEFAQLKPLARPIYPHWKERRLARNGKPIIPQLDYDESNENNPYVCFRRRELKSSRKTRRSDAQNIERLTKLRNDLFAAHELLKKVRDRERLKLEAIELERRVFEVRVEARELKRRLGEADGDEDLLVGRRDKKRRKEDAAAANAAGSLRLSIRKPDPSNLNPALLITSAEDLKARKDRAVAIASRIDRDLQKKRESDQAWDDHTDGAYVPRAPATPARYWRAVEGVQGSTTALQPHRDNSSKLEALGFATQYQPVMGRVRTSFRRRVGRGGRVMLDRIAPTPRSSSLRASAASSGGGGSLLKIRLSFESDVSEYEEEGQEEAEARQARRDERLRYDSDSHYDFACADEPVILDDFELRHLVKRTGLLKPDDLAQLALDTSYLEQAYQWAATDPDKHAPPPQTFGRPPPRPPLAQSQNPNAMLQLGANGGQPYNPAQMAAAQALRVAQQQAQLKRQQQVVAAAQAAGLPVDQASMRRTPSSGSPQNPNAGGLVNGNAANGPIQVNWNGADANKIAAAAAANGIVLPPGFQLPNGAQFVQQRMPNGIVNGANGANGFPVNARLQSPQISNLQMALQAQAQQQQQAQLAAASQGIGQGSSPLQLNAMGLNNNPNSRPGSAASSHHQQSPSLMNQGLPSPQTQNPRVGSPAQYAQQLAAGQGLKMQQMPHPGQFSGFAAQG